MPRVALVTRRARAAAVFIRRHSSPPHAAAGSRAPFSSFHRSGTEPENRANRLRTMRNAENLEHRLNPFLVGFPRISRVRGERRGTMRILGFLHRVDSARLKSGPGNPQNAG